MEQYNYRILHEIIRELNLNSKVPIDLVKIIFEDLIKEFYNLNRRKPTEKELYALALLALDEAMMKVSYVII
ncbi:MAG TPA: hypothetical protein EYH40_01670 [Desulfurococcales archaeon]|nr:hypothetical protein [Desulfurococcales archaeon]